MIDELVLTDSISALRSQIDVRRAELRRLSEELQHAERELQLLGELADLRGIQFERKPEAGGEGPTPALQSVTDNLDDQLQQGVIRILRATGTPIHIQDLLSRVREAGIRIPGRGTSANLIGSISPNPAIVRPVRGMYGLREWGLSDRPTLKKPASGRRQTSRRKRRQQHPSHLAARRDLKDATK